MPFKYILIEIVLLAAFVLSAVSFSRFQQEHETMQRNLRDKTRLRDDLVGVWTRQSERAMQMMVVNVILAAFVYITLMVTIFSYLHHHS